MSKLLNIFVIALGAVVAGVMQWLAAASVWHPAGAVDPLLRTCALQAAAGFAEAMVIRAGLPSAYRQPRAVSFLFLWLTCTFVPLLGGLIVLLNCVCAALFSRRHASGMVSIVRRPAFPTGQASGVSRTGGARLQASLANGRVPAGDRLSALVAVQSLPTRVTSKLLRALLSDPLDDIRLIAYGTLDQAENEIMQKIFRAGKALESTGREAERHALSRLLAELLFELVYQRLVLGDVYRHTLQQADRYAQAALEIVQEDAALWLIRGRIALTNGHARHAQEHIGRALELGFPRERLVPWLAEAEFLLGNYANVSRLLTTLGNTAATPTLEPIVRYWA